MVEPELFVLVSSFAFGALKLRLFFLMPFAIGLSLKEDDDGARGQLWTLFGCGKVLAVAVKHHSSIISTMLMRTKLASGCVARDEEIARAGNASINIVDCVHRSIMRTNISSRAHFSAMSVRTVSIN